MGWQSGCQDTALCAQHPRKVNNPIVETGAGLGHLILSVLSPINDRVAEWLRAGLQIRLPWFDSGRGLHLAGGLTADANRMYVMENEPNSQERRKWAGREWKKMTREERIARMLEISDRCAALPVLDDRSPDEILGCNARTGFSTREGPTKKMSASFGSIWHSTQTLAAWRRLTGRARRCCCTPFGKRGTTTLRVPTFRALFWLKVGTRVSFGSISQSVVVLQIGIVGQLPQERVSGPVWATGAFSGSGLRVSALPYGRLRRRLAHQLFQPRLGLLS